MLRLIWNLDLMGTVFSILLTSTLVAGVFTYGTVAHTAHPRTVPLVVTHAH